MLRPHVDSNCDPTGDVSRGDTALNFVAILSSWTRAPGGFNLHVTIIERELVRGFGIQNGHSNSGRLDPAPFFCRGDSLKSVPSGFVLKELLGSLALKEDRNESWAFI